MKEGEFKKINRIVIAGLGMMGGSFAKAIRKNGFEGVISGFDPDSDSLEFAVRSNIIDKSVSDLKIECESADMIVIATPVGKYKRVIELIRDVDTKGLIITDLGSVKDIYGQIEGMLPKNSVFVGAHPMAGSEKSGVENSIEDLFEGKKIFITASIGKKGVHEVEEIMKMTGADTIMTCPKLHDRAAAITSHLPHLNAAILVELFNETDIDGMEGFVGSGFIDSTRIASGQPDVWKDIFIHNSEMVDVIEEFQHRLENFKKAIVNREDKKIHSRLSAIKKTRDAI